MFRQEERAISGSSPAGPHPLALALAQRYRAQAFDAPVIEIGAGSGRNARYFNAADIPCVSTGDDESYTQLPGERDGFAAALSTHAYLHGTVPKLRAGMAELRRVLRPRAPIFITLGSIEDSRFGLGVAYDETTFAPGEGDEAGVPHPYFDRSGVIELLGTAFEIESLDERNVDDIVGRWAHAQPRGMVHWLVVAARRDP